MQFFATRGRPPFLTLIVYMPWLNRLVSKTVSGGLFGPQRSTREMTVSSHVGACVKPASTWGILRNLSFEPCDFLLKPQRPQQNGKSALTIV